MGFFCFKAEIFCLSFDSMCMKILKSFICGCRHFLFGLLEVLRYRIIQRFKYIEENIQCHSKTLNVIEYSPLYTTATHSKEMVLVL